MAVSYVDTNNTKEISKDIIDYANQYDILINRLFKRLSEVPNLTKEWVGPTSEKYFRIVANDKNEFISFGQNIRNYGQAISNIADSLDDMIDKNNKEEGDKNIDD